MTITISLHVLIIIIIAIAFMLYFLYKFLMPRLIDKRISQYQNQLIENHISEIDSLYHKIRGWRHDYHNHIQIMIAYLELGKTEEMMKYLRDLDKDLSTIDQVIKTGNIMVDSILNTKISIAEKNNIRVVADAVVSDKIAISDIDLCAIIGNLLDNAIEACMTVENEEERFIRIYIAEKMDQFYIYVSNSFEGKLNKKGSKYFTTKDERQRGYGLIRIDGIIKKNQGMINRQSEKNIFATEIILPLAGDVLLSISSISK